MKALSIIIALGLQATRALSATQQRQFACQVARRALLAERAHGREPDPVSWKAVEIAERYAAGLATLNELEGASDAAWEVNRATHWKAQVIHNYRANQTTNHTAIWSSASAACCTTYPPTSRSFDDYTRNAEGRSDCSAYEAAIKSARYGAANSDQEPGQQLEELLTWLART